MLYIVERERGYHDRTKHNAKTGHVTVAFAVDFATAGEVLTKRLAGDRYIGIPLETDPIDAARLLYRKINAIPAEWIEQAGGRILNVAGNGLRTLDGHDWTQERADAYVYEVLAKVHEFLHLHHVISGGQTGIDISGGIAGMLLADKVTLTFPKGLIQRFEQGPDREHTEEQIRAQVQTGVDRLIATYPALAERRISCAKPAPDAHP